MIDKAYIDTSILAAYYCPESISDNVEKLLLSVKKPIISLLTEVELYSVIAKKTRNKELTKRDAHQIQTIYMNHNKEGYYLKLSLNPEHYTNARDLLSSSHSLFTLDAIHLAIAIAEKIPLLTADKTFGKTATKMNVKVFYP